MEKKKLYLLMQTYPVAPGEDSFIGPEIPYLKENFDITAVPLEKVTVSAFEKIKALVKTVFSPMVYREAAAGAENGKGFAKVFPFSLFMLWRANIYADYLKKNVFEAEEAIVYCYWYNEIALGALLLKKYFPEYKFITRCHGYDLYDFRVPGEYHPYKKFMDEKLDRVVFACNHAKKYYLDRHGKADSGRYPVHHLGVPPKERVVCPAGKTLKLLSCSNLLAIKRVDLIISALMLIKDFPVEWHIAGDGPEVEALQNAAKNLPVNVKCHFMGYVPNDEYISWVKENPVDLFITTSSTEGGVPVSLSEMASFGIPCIGTDVGGIPEIVSDKNGTLLSANPTAEEVAQAITDFYHLSSEERKQKGDNSYKLWQNSFNSETNAQRVVEMLKQI